MRNVSADSARARPKPRLRRHNEAATAAYDAGDAPKPFATKCLTLIGALRNSGKSSCCLVARITSRIVLPWPCDPGIKTAGSGHLEADRLEWVH
jgi:hypothetical protein